MHEASIAKSILTIVGKKLNATARARRATRVAIIVGEFRNVEKETLQMAFDNLKTTYAGLEDCELIYQAVEPLALCADSAHQFIPRFKDAFRCTQCGSGIGKLVRGNELDIINLTLEADTEGETAKLYA